MQGTTGSLGCRITTCCTTSSPRRVCCSWPTCLPSSPPAPDPRAASAAPRGALHRDTLRQPYTLNRSTDHKGAVWNKRAVYQPMPADMHPVRGGMTQHITTAYRCRYHNRYWSAQLADNHRIACQLMLLRSMGRLRLLARDWRQAPPAPLCMAAAVCCHTSYTASCGACRLVEPARCSTSTWLGPVSPVSVVAGAGR